MARGGGIDRRFAPVRKPPSFAGREPGKYRSLFPAGRRAGGLHAPCAALVPRRSRAGPARHPPGTRRPLDPARARRRRSASPLRHQRANGVAAGGHDDQRAVPRSRISGRHPADPGCGARLAVGAPFRDDARRGGVQQPLHGRVRRGASPRAIVPAPAGRHLARRHRHAIVHREDGRRVRLRSRRRRVRPPKLCSTETSRRP